MVIVGVMTLTACAARAGSFMPSAPHVRAFGAMAIAPSLEPSGQRAAFFAVGLTKRDAIHSAVSACTRRARDCKVPVWVKNGYAAVAYQPFRNGAYGYGWGSSRVKAVSEAEQACSARDWGYDCVQAPDPGRIVSGATPSPGRFAAGGPPGSTSIEVPFATQNGTGQSNCGPAALTMVIRYYGGSATVTATARAMRGNLVMSVDGALALDPGPSSVPGRQGYTDVTAHTAQWWLDQRVPGLGEEEISTFGQIRNEIDHQHPVIVPVLMHGGNHYVVVTGYSSRDVYLNDPDYYGPSEMPIASFTAARARASGDQQAVSFGYFAPPDARMAFPPGARRIHQ